MSPDITQNKNDALTEIIRLAQSHDISIDEIGASLTKDNLTSKDSKWLTYLLGYLGAAFIFGGLGLFIAMTWDDLSSASRVIITYFPGLIAFILGIMVLHDEKYKKASTPLFLKSAILLPTGMFTFLKEYAQGDDAQMAAMLIFGLLSFQFLTTFFKFRRTSLLFFGYLFWSSSIGIFMDRVGVPGEALGITLGASILMFAWYIDKTNHRAISPFWYAMGAIGLLWSTFDLIEGVFPVDILYLPLTIYLMTLSTRMKSRTLLMVSTFALLGFLGYFTDQYFADTTGWPIALIIMGFMLIGVSTYAVKLGRKIKS